MALKPNPKDETMNTEQTADKDRPWKIAEFWSSSTSGKKVWMLANVEDIERYGAHRDFIRWVAESDQIESQASIISELKAQVAGLEKDAEALTLLAANKLKIEWRTVQDLECVSAYLDGRRSVQRPIDGDASGTLRLVIQECLNGIAMKTPIPGESHNG